MSNNINQLLDALDYCKPSGKDKWIARCPGHNDKSPSLSITLKSDGRILIFCHAGCGATEVLESIGLEFDVLFPEELDGHSYPGSRRKQQQQGPTYDDCLLAITKDAVARGERLTQEEKESALEAFSRQRSREI